MPVRSFPDFNPAPVGGVLLGPGLVAVGTLRRLFHHGSLKTRRRGGLGSKPRAATPLSLALHGTAGNPSRPLRGRIPPLGLSSPSRTRSLLTPGARRSARWAEGGPWAPCPQVYATPRTVPYRDSSDQVPAASLMASVSCSNVGAPAGPSGVEYRRHVSPKSLRADGNGSRPSIRIDGEPAKRYRSAASCVSTRQCSIVVAKPDRSRAC